MTSFPLPDGDADGSPASLSISEVSRRTGIPVAAAMVLLIPGWE